MQSVNAHKPEGKEKELVFIPSSQPPPQSLNFKSAPLFWEPQLVFWAAGNNANCLPKKKSHKKQHLNSEQFKEITLAEEAKDLLSKENPWFF